MHPEPLISSFPRPNSVQNMFDTPNMPEDSHVLIMDVNGYIGAHIADQFLTYGYLIRGTVRPTSRWQWMLFYFSNKQGPDRIELAVVSDIMASGSLDTAVQGCAGFVHVASSVYMQITDVDAHIKEAEKGAVIALEAARRGKFKAISFLSSSWALYTPSFKTAKPLTEDSWNEESVSLAYSEKMPPGKGIAPFMVGKVRTEHVCWEWINTNQPLFTFNTIQVSSTFGPLMNPEHQSYGTTAGPMKSAFNGENTAFLNTFPPQKYVDMRDVGRVHVAGIIDPSTDGKRLLAFAQDFNWNPVVKVFKQKSPGEEFSIKGSDRDLAQVDNKRGETLLKALGRRGWVPLEESLSDTVDGYRAGGK